MNHKEKMTWLKENDPISYYELTSDPTGGGNGDGSGWEILVIMGLILTAGFLFIKFIWK